MFLTWEIFSVLACGASFWRRILGRAVRSAVLYLEMQCLHMGLDQITSASYCYVLHAQSLARSMEANKESHNPQLLPLGVLVAPTDGAKVTRILSQSHHQVGADNHGVKDP
jgi:hypothetical protein